MTSLVDYLMPLSSRRPKPKGLINGMPNYGYGGRWSEEQQGYDKSNPKAPGYYGEVARPGEFESFSTEIGISGDYGEEPTMVPGMTHRQLVDLLTTLDGQKFNKSAYIDADKHAELRRLLGKSQWHGVNDKASLLPLPIPESSLSIADYLARLR